MTLSLENVTKKIDLVLRDYELPVTCVSEIRYSNEAVGNRMFLFASAYGLAHLHACHLY
ncbi:unnamed protein product, partial [Rotaria sp. Silwood1]